jgi:hypothetical protein
MDKVFSARLDEKIVDDIDRTSRRLGISKKQLVEEAIRLRVAHARTGADDVWAETCGTWRRRESPLATIEKTRRAFEAGMHRHGVGAPRPPRRGAGRP